MQVRVLLRPSHNLSRGHSKKRRRTKRETKHKIELIMMITQAV